MRLMLLLFLLQTASQESRFAGEWRTVRKGKACIIITLKASERLQGTVRLGKVGLDEDGKRIECEEASSFEGSLTEIKIASDTLTFASRDQDGDDTDFAMKLTGSSTADLQVQDVMKSIPLTRR